jgi:hypothetical protein
MPILLKTGAPTLDNGGVAKRNDLGPFGRVMRLAEWATQIIFKMLLAHGSSDSLLSL